MATWEDLTKVLGKEYIDSIFLLAELNKPYDLETPVSTEILEGLMFIIGGAMFRFRQELGKQRMCLH